MSGSDFETIRIDKQDGITFLTMNRPEKRNAMNPQMHYEMDRALPELEADPDTKVVVLTGAGETFCAGQDLREYFRGLDDNPAERRRVGGWSTTTNRPSPWSMAIASAADLPRC